ncbi:MAG: PaaI family thioesterase [Myxococcales bacterium]|nr:PaaI family thioesterase [Myxococcales bacterium]
MPDPDDQDFAAMIRAADARGGWNHAMGLTVLRATRAEVVAEVEVGDVHRQPYGLVHGGVYAGVIEAVASMGAALHAMSAGRGVVGLENHTSFLRAVRAGKLSVVARPLACGRTSHVWEGTVHDAEGRLAATGRVRLLVLEAGAQVAGAPAAVPGSG